MAVGNPLNVRKAARGVLLVTAITAGVTGWIVARGSDTVIIPYPDEAGVSIDSPIALDSFVFLDAPLAFDAGIPLLTAWEMHTISPHSFCDGADGTNMADVDGDGDLDIVTACEQGGKVILAKNDGCAASWTIIQMPGPTLSGPEDARFGDVDGDGDLDIVEAESGGAKLKWYRNNAGSFGGGLPITITSGTERFMHAVVYAPGVIFSGSYSTGASVRRWNSSDAGLTWTSTLLLADAGWVKGMEVRNGDDLLLWLYTGSRRGVSWITDASVGSGTLGTRLTTDVNTLRGSEKDGVISTVVGSSDGVSAGLSVSIVGGATPSFPTSFGRAQASQLGDIDGDGVDDLVLTASHADAVGISSVVWLKGPAFTQRGEISGDTGIKHDNAVITDVNCDGHADVVTTEEKSLGLIFYENPL